MASFSRGGVGAPVPGSSATATSAPSVLVTKATCRSSEWGQIFQGESRMTGALPGPLHAPLLHIFEMNGESYRFRRVDEIQEGAKVGLTTESCRSCPERPSLEPRGVVKTRAHRGQFLALSATSRGLPIGRGGRFSPHCPSLTGRLSLHRKQDKPPKFLSLQVCHEERRCGQMCHRPRI